MTTLPARPPLARSSDRVIAGVCSGLAAHLGWPVKAVRLGMVLASFAGGAGLVFYAWLWIMVPTADEADRRNARRPASPIAPAVSQSQGWQAQGWQVQGTAADGGTSAGAAGSVAGSDASPAGPPWFRVRGVRYGKEILLGCGLLLVAGIMIAQLLGVDVPLGTLIPAAAVLGGASIAWMQLDETRRAGLVDKTKADQAGGWGRLAAGLALVVAGVLVMVSGSGSWEQTWLALLASVAVLGGVVLVLLPWALKFWRDLEAERAGRI
ncbi:MAG: PspC domain-containing protein, partial [Actinomycetes bacterium]